ncbi:MAG: hypothetical protein QOF76_1951 [Solirubrobacteraceae bacterium]|jgi:uncharacterized protein (DUF2267 family)|nr:hypothetical protein [Solirubrobacteraceae bacterium]
MRFDEFMAKVRERSGLDEDQAERAVRATLNTLAQRLAGGEPKDFASQLPQELKDTTILTTGAGEGRDMSAEEFVRTVADREGCSPEQARDHVRAVLTTLREAVTPGEWDDIEAQLGRDYGELLAGVGAGRA